MIIVKEDSAELNENSLEESNNLQEGLFATSEGRILITGLTITVLSLIGLGLSCLRSPDKSHFLVAVTATNILFGRAAGMSVGYAAGFGHSVVIPLNMLIETILVLLFYPLFVFSWRRLIVIKALKKLMKQTSKAAETHRETIRRYGILGLFIFVWSPFWMTGPIVGCAIGFLLGLRPWFNLTAVLLGTYLAITCWAIFLREIIDYVAGFNAFAPIILAAIVICIVVLGYVLHGIRGEDHSKNR